MRKEISTQDRQRPLQVQITEHKRNAEIEVPPDPKQLNALGMTKVDYIKTKQKAPTEMERDFL